jgi:CheY-like chemotaxis protein
MSGGRILIVEDNALNRELAVVVLKSAGYEVLECETAEEGLRVAAKEQPDLILLDIRLPGMDGFRALERLRADPRTAGITVVALTAQAMLGDEAAARAAGFAGYITKPINTRRLAQEVAAFLPVRRSEGGDG